MTTKKTTIAGYGSLFSTRSAASTFQREVEMKLEWLEGWYRCWDAGSETYSYCNIRQDPAGLSPSLRSRIVVATFEVTPLELNVLRAREWGYTLTEVARGLHAFVWVGPQPPRKDKKERPVLESYIDVCVMGALNQGLTLSDFWHDTVSPSIVLDDLEDPLYSEIYHPWSQEGVKAMNRLKRHRWGRKYFPMLVKEEK